MKKKDIFKAFLVLGMSVGFTACTDVVDVDVPVAEPRLVIEASMDWEIAPIGPLVGSDQTIKLSMSTPYFSSEEATPVTGAMVTVVNDATNEVYIFTDQNDGTYVTHSFEPVINQSFTLTVEYDGQVYKGSDTFNYGTVIDDVWQTKDGGFDKDLIEINIAYTDNADAVNYYLLRYYRHGDLLPALEVDWDEFTNGNQLTDFYEVGEDDDDEDPFAAGDVLDIYIYGLSEAYFNYMAILLEQAESGGNPFGTIPVALKGNCKNMSGGKDAYGYFRTTTVNKVQYTVQ